MTKLVEVSHPVRDGMQTYPGLPAPQVTTILSYEESERAYRGASAFHIASLHLCGNTGTYIDAPMHRYPGAADLAALPLERLADLPVTVVDARDAGRRIDASTFGGAALRDRAVLVRTDWSRHWGTDDYAGAHPFLTRDAAETLSGAGVRFVGIDSLNIDDREDLARPVHTVLLSAGIPICEHMTNLGALSGEGRLHAVPIAWVGGASFPVRGYVIER